MSEDRKIGAGALKAWVRQGAKEFAQVLPATKDSIQIVEEPGQIGNATPGDVDRQRAAEPMAVKAPEKVVNEAQVVGKGAAKEPEMDR